MCTELSVIFFCANSRFCSGERVTLRLLNNDRVYIVPYAHCALHVKTCHFCTLCLDIKIVLREMIRKLIYIYISDIHIFSMHQGIIEMNESKS